MIYLDYAANTPADEAVLNTFCEVARSYPANPNSPHPLGLAAKERLEQATRGIAALLGVREQELIYTSGASESNNLAIKGAAQQYKKYGRHIVTTYLEHSSVNGPMAYLQALGFEVDYVNITESGQVDLEHLTRLLRDDTILVSVCAVDSELGLRQDIEALAKITSQRPHCLLHVDAAQAVGRVPLSLEPIDLVTVAPHKFYGLNGIGILVKKERVLLEPQIHGGISTTPFRSGTPALALAASAETALSLALSQLQERYERVERLNTRLRQALARYAKVKINSTAHSVPFILNISLLGAKAELFQQALAEDGINVATKSACCAPNTVSRPVFALTKDKKAALSTLRISLSHLTTQEETDAFLSSFAACYQKLCR